MLWWRERGAISTDAARVGECRFQRLDRCAVNHVNALDDLVAARLLALDGYVSSIATMASRAA